MVSIGDMLAATDRLGAPDTPGHGSRAQPSFYIACSRFLPGTNMKTAAHLMYLHMHHHLKLGFQARLHGGAACECLSALHMVDHLVHSHLTLSSDMMSESSSGDVRSCACNRRAGRMIETLGWAHPWSDLLDLATTPCACVLSQCCDR